VGTGGIHYVLTNGTCHCTDATEEAEMVFELALKVIRTKRAAFAEEDAQALLAPIATGGDGNTSFSTAGSDMSLGNGVDVDTLRDMMVEEHQLEEQQLDEETAMAEADDFIVSGSVAPLRRSGSESPNLRAQR
jgi:hypothetical protein